VEALASRRSAHANKHFRAKNVPTAAKFEAHFARMCDAAEPMIEFGPAIEAMEPK
jgi:hypothetical protein